MSASPTAEAPPVPAWRYKAGLFLFIIGNVLTLTSPVVVPALGLNAALIAAVVIVGEILVLSSVFFIGWRGMKELKGKMLGYLKWHPGAKPVGRFRFRLGMFLTFMLAVVLNYLAFLLLIFAYAGATPADPFPTTWGIPYDYLGWTVSALFVAGEISLFAGLYVLGEEWWKRSRDLFIWREAEAR